MAVNIVEMLSSSVGKDLVAQASRFLGESEAATTSAVGSALPAMLGGLMQKATTPAGAADLMRSISAPNIDTNLLSNLGGLLSGGDKTSSLISMGNNLLSGLFGGKTSALTDAVASVAGIKPSSAKSLMAMAAPLLFGFLKRQVNDNNLNATGLANLLLGQKGFLQRTGLDSRITKALGFDSVSSMLGTLPSSLGETATSAAAAAPSVAPAGASGLRKFLPWLIAALAAIVLYSMFMRPKPEQPVAVAPPAPPAAATAPATASLPAKIYFEVDVATLGSDGQTTIAAIADQIKGAGTKVNITGYADPSGDATKNAELAKERAKAVRDALQAAGVTEANINMNPPASITGSGSDMEARRVEITAQ